MVRPYSYRAAAQIPGRAEGSASGEREAKGNCRANGLDPCILYTPLEFREAARVRGSPTEGTAEGATYRTGQVLSASITVKQRKRKMEL